MSSGAIRAGKAEVELGVRDRLQRGLAKAEKKLRDFGKGAFVAGAGAVGAAAGILAPILMAASNAQETAGKFDTVFGGQAASVREWGTAFADEVGRSREQIESFMAGSQDLLVPLGFEPGAATEISKTLTGLSIDLASFNNGTDADAMNDLQAALTGSGEVMKKYGVALNETATKQELLNMGLDPKHATEAEKAQARLNIIMAGTTAAQGDAVRTGGSFANQLKRLKASVSNVAVAIGNVLLPPATWLIGMLNKGAIYALDFAEKNKTLFGIIGGGVAVFGAIAGLVAGVGGAAIAGSFAIGALGSAISVAMGILAAVAGPALIVAAVIGSIGAAIYYYRDYIMEYGRAFWEQIRPVREAMATIWELVTTAFSGIKSALSAGDFTDAARILWTGIQAVFYQGAEYAGQAFEWLFGEATGWLKGIGDAVMSGDFSLAFDIAWAQIQVTFSKGTTTVSKGWSLFVFGLGETFGEVIASIRRTFYSVMQSVAGLLQSTMEKIRGVIAALAEYDPTGLSTKTVGALDALGKAYAAAGRRFGELEEQEGRERDARRQARYEALTGRFAKADEALAKKRQALADLVGKAQEGREALGSSMADRKRRELEMIVDKYQVADPEKIKEVTDQQDTGMKKGGKLTAAQGGTFSSVAASLMGLGRSTATEETAKNTRKTNEILQRMMTDGGFDSPPTFA